MQMDLYRKKWKIHDEENMSCPGLKIEVVAVLIIKGVVE